MSAPQEVDNSLVKSGRKARAFHDEQGRRVYGPFRIRLEVQLSPLAVTSDTFEFWIYQASGEAAIDRAGFLLRAWHVVKRIPFTGWPKPVGHGMAIPTSDEEFRMTWKQAVAEGKEVLRAGVQDDPVAFHIKPTGKVIFTGLNI